MTWPSSRIRRLTIAVGLAGVAALWLTQGAKPAAGFLMGAALSILNFQGLSMLAVRHRRIE